MAEARATSHSAGNLHSVTSSSSTATPQTADALNLPPPPYPGSIDGRDICLRSSLSDLLRLAANNRTENAADNGGTNAAGDADGGASPDEVPRQRRAQSYPALVNWQLEPAEIAGNSQYYTDDDELQLPRYDAIYGSVDQFSPNYASARDEESAYQRQQTEPASLDRALLANRSRRSQRQQRSRIGRNEARGQRSVGLTNNRADNQIEGGASVNLANRRRASIRLAQMSPISLSTEDLPAAVGAANQFSPVPAVGNNQLSVTNPNAHSEGDITSPRRQQSQSATSSRQRLFRFFSGGNISASLASSNNPISTFQSGSGGSGLHFPGRVSDNETILSPSNVSSCRNLDEQEGGVNVRTISSVASFQNNEPLEQSEVLDVAGETDVERPETHQQDPGTPLIHRPQRSIGVTEHGSTTAIQIDPPLDSVGLRSPTGVGQLANGDTNSPTSDLGDGTTEQVVCPFCHATVRPVLVNKSSWLQYILCLIIAFAGGLLGCCLLPFFCNQLGDSEFYCPNCREEIEKPFAGRHSSGSRQRPRSTGRHSSARSG